MRRRLLSSVMAGAAIALVPLCALSQASQPQAAQPVAAAPISLSTAVGLALRNSPRVRMAQADVLRAKASLAETKDALIPSVTSNGGIGRSVGVPLSLPVVFSMAAQSLAFNFSQPDYIRAGHSAVTSASFALDAVRDDVVEDTVSTYVGLDNAQQRLDALATARGISARIEQITEDRVTAGTDPRIEAIRAHHTGVQLRLQTLFVIDEVETLADHLRRLTGLPAGSLRTITDSIPKMQSALPRPVQLASADSSSVRAAFASAQAKQYVAHGDRRYTYLPQFSFGAGYSRISTVGTSYTDYYPGFNTASTNPNAGARKYGLNSLDVGVQVSIPLLDYVHRARARVSAADAAHAIAEAENARMQFGEGQLKLAHAEAELEARTELAALDRDMAQDQLETVLLQLQAGASNAGPPLNPRDEQNARLQERQRYIEMLTTELQLRQAQLSLMRQGNSLGGYVGQTIEAPGSSAPPSAGTVTPVNGGAGSVAPERTGNLPTTTTAPHP